MKPNKLVIALDFDDSLCECTSVAIQMANEKLHTSLSFEAITSWSFTEQSPKERETLLQVFDDPAFYERQVPMAGSVDMVKALLGMGHDVLIVSAVRPGCMSKRANQIQQFFPMVPKDNILLGARKDVVYVDILLDDALHNIKSTGAKYPVLYRRPWNAQETGILSVSNYDEFLCLVRRISNMAPLRPKATNKPYIVCLVGPSGSGKTSIANTLLNLPSFGVPHSVTTRPKRPGEPPDGYQFVSADDFEHLRASGELLEETAYAGHLYGTQKSEIQKLWDSGKHVIVPIDMNGATAMKARYGPRAVLAFIRRDMADILNEVVSRNVSVEEKVSRILSLNHEFSNESLCDFTVINRSTLEAAAQQIIDYLK